MASLLGDTYYYLKPVKNAELLANRNLKSDQPFRGTTCKRLWYLKIVLCPLTAEPFSRSFSTNYSVFNGLSFRGTPGYRLPFVKFRLGYPFINFSKF